MQINFINSLSGQLALSDIRNVDPVSIIAGAEHELDTVCAPEEEKTRARQILHEPHDTRKSLVLGASGELLAAVVRKAVGHGWRAPPNIYALTAWYAAVLLRGVGQSAQR